MEKKKALSKGYVMFAMLAPVEGLIWPSSSATARPFSKVSRKKNVAQKLDR